MAIAANPPITNPAAAEKQKAAQAIHAQSQFKAGSQPGDISAINKLGEAFTGQQQQADVAGLAGEAASDVADIEREQQAGQLEQTEANIQDQEQLTMSIQDQKNKLISMNIGITEDQFADDMTIRRIKEDQNFANETQLNDLALLSINNKEDYQNMLQDSYQRTQAKQVNDQWELDVYRRAAQDEATRSKIMKDETKTQEIQRAAAEAERKADEAKGKAGKMKKVIGAAKVVGGAVAMYYSGGTVGGSMVASGASDVASES